MGERIEEIEVPRGRGNKNKDINYFLNLLFDIPPKPTDALISALLFMFFYTFVSSIIYDLILLNTAETLKIVMFVLVVVVLFPTLLSFYAITRNIQLLMGVIYRFVFALVGVVFGTML
ncbi:MAG: hypothetical protein WCO45_06650 [Pseudanabaena sp. ELA607]